MQFWRFKIYRDKHDNKLTWSYNDMRLVNPFLIVWRLFWWPIMWVFILALYVVILLSQGKFAADEFMDGMT